MAFKWTNDLAIQVIELYKQSKCLWDHTDMQYKCRNEKHDAWTKMCEAVGANQEKVRRKMKNLIAQFYRERKKYHSLKKSGAGATVVLKWFAYDYMLFLAEKNKPRPCSEKGFDDIQEVSDTSGSDAVDDLSESQQTIRADTIENTTEETRNIVEKNTQSTEHTLIKSQRGVSSIAVVAPVNEPEAGPSSAGTFENNRKLKEFKSPKKKAQKRKSNAISLDERQEEAYMVLKQLQNKEPRSRFQVFGEHVALKLQNLHTEHARNMAEHLISNILWEASMGKYDQPFDSHSNSWRASSSAPLSTTSSLMLSPANSSTSEYQSGPSLPSMQMQTMQAPLHSPALSCVSELPNLPINDETEECAVKLTDTDDSSILYQALRDANL